MSVDILIKNVFRRFNSVSAIKIAFDPEVSRGGHMCNYMLEDPARLLNTHDGAPLIIAGIRPSAKRNSIIDFNNYAFLQYEKPTSLALGHFLHALAKVPCERDQAVTLIKLFNILLDDVRTDMRDGKFEPHFTDFEMKEALEFARAENENLRAALARERAKYTVKISTAEGKFAGISIKIANAGSDAGVVVPIPGGEFTTLEWRTFATATDPFSIASSRHTVDYITGVIVIISKFTQEVITIPRCEIAEDLAKIAAMI